MQLITYTLSLYLFGLTFGFPDQAKWSFRAYNKNCQYFSAHSALYKNSSITIQVTCDQVGDKTAKITLGWVLRRSPCFDEYFGPDLLVSEYLKWYYHCPSTTLSDFGYDTVKYLKTSEIEVPCNHYIDLTTLQGNFSSESASNSTRTRHCQPPDEMYCDSQSDHAYPLMLDTDSLQLKRGHKATVPEDGVYLFILYIKSSDTKSSYNITVDLNFKSPTGQFLSGVDEPLLTFYAMMSCLYLLYAFIWFIVSLIQWKDLLRIQFYIAIVILLGMLEKAIFYGVYQSINSQGVLNRNVYYLAEIFSCLKRTLARVLVIIVSCGYEIIKPHLGQTLNKIVFIGLLYFILSSLEASLRIYKPKNDPSNQTLLAGIPLALLDSTISWWIFSNLMQTTRVLRLRKNHVKMELFNYFTNVLVFAILASIGFMIWQIHIHKFTVCLRDWKTLWFDEAYWHILFSVILLAIMVLWRPTNNNQRYAFTPLLDTSDDEQDDNHSDSHRLVESNNVKMRITKSPQGSIEDSNVDGLSKETVDNLKWIEENISTSMIDSSIPSLMDSDEELLNTKFEISKMQ